MRTVVVVAALLASAGATGDTSTASPAAGAVVEVRFQTTPGKPMQLAKSGEPAERITVSRSGAKMSIEVARNVGSEYQTGRAELDAADWRKIESVIAAHSLTTWKARPTGQRADDFSTTAFTLLANGGKLVNEQRWHQPTEHVEDPGALAELLGQLAKRKVARPALFYF